MSSRTGKRLTKKTKKAKKAKTHKKKWLTAVDVAQKTLTKTGSLSKARTALRLQAFQNARKLFGSVGERR